jgi:hypothetical protein
MNASDGANALALRSNATASFTAGNAPMEGQNLIVIDENRGSANALVMPGGGFEYFAAKYYNAGDNMDGLHAFHAARDFAKHSSIPGEMRKTVHPIVTEATAIEIGQQLAVGIWK